MAYIMDVVVYEPDSYEDFINNGTYIAKYEQYPVYMAVLSSVDAKAAMVRYEDGIHAFIYSAVGKFASCYTYNTDTEYYYDSGAIFDRTNNIWIGVDEIVDSDMQLEVFNSYDDFVNYINGNDKYPITYRDTNCTHSGPDEAAAGDEVSVTYQFPAGYGIVNPSTDLYVTNNGVLIPSTYADGKLTFTMPEQS